MKACTKCQQQKPFSAFHKEKKGKNGFNSQCKDCRSMKTWPKDDPRRRAHYDRSLAWGKTPKGRRTQKRRYWLEVANHPEREALRRKREGQKTSYKWHLAKAFNVIALEALN